MKTCNTCGDVKPVSEFPKHKKCRGGVRPKCKACKKEVDRCYRQANQEKVRETKRRYRQANRDSLREYDQRYREANLGKEREADRRYRKAHPEKAQVQSQRRQAKMRGLPADLTSDQWEWLLKKTGHRCIYCERHESEVGTLHQEHVIPVSQGGWYTPSNIRPACASCNGKKGPRTPEQAGMREMIVINTLEAAQQEPLF